MVKCGYCGRENTGDAAACSGCGTQLTETAQVPSRGLEGPSIGKVMAAAVGIASLAAGHPTGILHTISALSDLDGDGSPAEAADSPHGMLERAAALESIDMRAAIALYDEIIRKHPTTSAAKEACRNIQTLKRAHPNL